MTTVCVLGGGLEGLAAAALIARGGARVALLEPGEHVAGAAAARELAGGHRTAGLPLLIGRLHPDLASLALERHGLERRPLPPVVVAGASDGGAPFTLPADPAELRSELDGAGSPRDAEGSLRWRHLAARAGALVREVLDDLAPELEPRGPAQLWTLARRGLALRRLGDDDLYELLRVVPMCAADWLNEHLEGARLKGALAAPAVWTTWMGPWSPGSAGLLFLAECSGAEWPRGGPAALARALEAAARAAGAELRAGAHARRLRLEGGRVRAVELAGGESVDADAVVSALPPRTTLLDLLPPGTLDPADARELRAFRSRGTTAVWDLALSAPLEIAGRAFERARSAVTLDELERSFDAVKYRRASERPLLEVHQTETDGRPVASALVHWAPHDLEGGWTDAARRSLEEAARAELERMAPGARERVAASELLVPPDLERRFGFSQGHPWHGELALDQLLSLRPGARCSRAATPVEGLFLAGPGCHPGPFVTGGSAALAARVLAATR